MLRFRNPGSNIDTQIRIFQTLYGKLKDLDSFNLEDMQEVLASTSLVTAYGYSGDKALAITSKRKSSLNSTKMNMKMYAEVFRMLGWVVPASRDKSYPLKFTLIGACAGNSNYEGALSLVEQALLGFVNPAEVSQNVKYSERVRFYPLVLQTLVDLGGIMHKKELCLGPMSCDENEENAYESMLQKLVSMRGDINRLDQAYASLCDELEMKPSSVDNCTRLPLGLLGGLGWINTGIHTTKLYGKPQVCFEISEKGRNVLKEYNSLVELSLDEFNELDTSLQESAIRLGAYSMLDRAGFDIASVEETRQNDTDVLRSILDGNELLLSPYQTLWPDTVNAALEFSPAHSDLEIVKDANEQKQLLDQESVDLSKFNVLDASAFRHKGIKDQSNERPSLIQLRNEITAAISQSDSLLTAAESLFNKHLNDKQSQFYPLVADLFTLIGLPCRESRAGDNGARWDAIIVDYEESIPIEIKSPTEELHLSLKAIRQALENKVILLSRNTHPTLQHTTSLAVGYALPNARAEVKTLIDDIYETYDIQIGVIGLHALFQLAIEATVNNVMINASEITSLKGILNVNI